MDALLLRVSEVAKVLGLGHSKVYQLIKSGRLPAVKVDGVVRVTRYAIEEYIATLPPLIDDGAAAQAAPAPK
jgi:excisionase family DNA binding protein